MPDRKMQFGTSRSRSRAMDPATLGADGGSLSQPSSEEPSTTRVARTLGILFFVAGIAMLGLWGTSLLIRTFGDSESRPFSGVGKALFHLGYASCGAGAWLIWTYPKWVKDTKRPGGLPTRNALSRSQHPVLLVATMIAPIVAWFAVMTGVLMFFGAVGQFDGIARGEPLMFVIAGTPVLLTAIYALIAGRRVWPVEDSASPSSVEPVLSPGSISVARVGARTRVHRSPFLERAWVFVRSIAPLFALFTAVTGIGVILHGLGWIDLSAGGNPWILSFCGFSIVVTSVYAWAAACELRPRDKSGWKD